MCFILISCNPFLDDILNAGKGDKKEIWLGYTSVDEAIAWLKTQPTGTTPNYPTTLALNIPLGAMPSDQWQALLSALAAINPAKYVTLDLSDCAMGSTTFDPDNTITTGKDRIVSLVLPKQTQIIADGYSYPTFNNFIELTQVSGANVKTIGENAFENSPKLTSVSMPKAEVVASSAFYGCTSLSSVYIPSAIYIQSYAFANTGNDPLIITLGINPPNLGSDIFYGVTGTPKQVTLRVPNAGMSSYDATWQNDFINSGNVVITVEPY